MVFVRLFVDGVHSKSALHNTQAAKKIEGDRHAKNHGKTSAVMQAMLRMRKIGIQGL